MKMKTAWPLMLLTASLLARIIHEGS
jgi:hypothetical protein